MIISCDRNKNDQYSFSTLDDGIVIKETGAKNKIQDLPHGE